MRKAVIVLATVCGVVYFSSCKKMYHCVCTFDNHVKYTKDLGSMYEDKAQAACSAYDSTVTGEAWKCTIY